MATTYTYSATSNENWYAAQASKQAKWNGVSGGTAPGSTTSTDSDVVIVTNATSAAWTLSFTETQPWYIGSLSVSGNVSGAEVLALTTDPLTVNGLITVGSYAAITLTGTDLTSTTSASGISNSGTISGYGTLAVNGGGGITGSGSIIASGGTLHLAGPVSGNNTFIIASSTASDLEFDNTASTGTIAISNANQKLEIGSAGALTITGNEVISNGTIQMDGGSLTDSSGLTINSGGTLIGSGTVNPTLSGTSGTVRAKGGVLDLVQNVAASSGLIFNVGTTAGSVLELGGTVGSGNTITFAGTTGAIELTKAGNFSGAVNGLQVETTATPTLSSIDYLNINTSGFSIASAKVVGSTIELFSGTGYSGTEDNIALSSAPAAGTYVDWGSDSTLGGTLGGQDVWLSNVVCFAAGTQIQTPSGEVCIETLREGDLVVTHTGEHCPVKWLGHMRINLQRHPHPDTAAPVRIRRGAFGENLPHRDLVVSPEHCLLVDGGLVPAKRLINDMTIVQERDTSAVTYYHVELDRHAILFAEGLPAESYLDTGNRAFFANAGLAVVLHPEFTINAGLKCWETDACAPLTVDAEAVKPIWQTLAERAEQLGYQRPDPVFTDMPDLRIEADGRTIRPLSTADNRYVFALPAGVTSARLTSRASVPSYFEPYLDDWRKLGVAVRRIVLRSGADLTEIPPDHPGLTQGWHAVEQDDATSWRWMDGNAVLPIRTHAPTVVEVQVAIVMRHAIDDAAEARLAA